MSVSGCSLAGFGYPLTLSWTTRLIKQTVLARGLAPESGRDVPVNWSFRLATVAVGLTLLHFHPANDSSADEFDARVEKWDAWSKHVWTWPVRTKATYSDQDPTDYNDRLLMPVDSEHYCLQLDYQSGGQQQRQVILRNPSYMAELARGLDDHWVIVGLTHSTEEKFGESLERGRSMNYFRRDVADPGSLLRKILNERESLNVMSKRDGQFDVFQLSPKSNATPEPGTLFAISSRFMIWFEDHASPSRIDYSYPGPDNETVNVSRVFDGWREVDGVDVPSRGRVFLPKGYSETDFPLETVTFDYSSINTPLRRGECYLSFYGLPEPGGPHSPGSVWLGLVILGVVVCSAGVYFWRRA